MHESDPCGRRGAACVRSTIGIGMALLLGSVAFAQSQIYRCVGANGAITMTNVACPQQTTGSVVQIRTNQMDMSDSRRETDKIAASQSAARAERSAQAGEQGDSREASAMSRDTTAEQEHAFAEKRRRYLLEQRMNHGTPRERAAAAAALAGIQETSANGQRPMGGGDTRRPIPSTAGGFFTPAAGGYISPKGRFCPQLGAGLMCDGVFVPLN